ncbi:hypothetical protein AGDE_08292 [Angomonas deanei]|nr:hypothetical protein AGDE_08292 [Angomonas deanei]|eukprot:EPY33421.1 hypothetical protein AGDE_08292 [Angomonas deanei]
MYQEDSVHRSAIVYNVPVSPFVPLQHLTIDITTVNRIAGYSLSFARERGWLQTEQEMVWRYNPSEHTAPLENTFFYGGWEAELAGPPSSRSRLPVRAPSTMLSWCECFVNHVGSSSYGVYVKVYLFTEGKMEDRTLLGSFKTVSVQVSKSLRTTVPLTPRKRNVLVSVYEGSAPLRASIERVKVERIDVAGLLKECHAFTADSSLRKASVDTALQAGSAFVRSFHLRETDIDFNLHLNQLAQTHMIINTLRSAVKENASVFSGWSPLGVEPIRADLMIESFRIDYVKEVPQDHQCLTVVLFPLEPHRVGFLHPWRPLGGEWPYLYRRWRVLHSILGAVVSVNPNVFIFNKYCNLYACLLHNKEYTESLTASRFSCTMWCRVGCCTF